MFVEMNVTNFRSFRDTQTFTLVKGKGNELLENTFSIEGVKDLGLLNSAVIYGANASGKSNIYEAFDYMTYYVSESFKFGDENEGYRKSEKKYIEVTPFLFDDNGISSGIDKENIL